MVFIPAYSKYTIIEMERYKWPLHHDGKICLQLFYQLLLSYFSFAHTHHFVIIIVIVITMARPFSNDVDSSKICCFYCARFNL